MEIFGQWDDDVDELDNLTFGNRLVSAEVPSKEMFQLIGRKLTINDIGKKIFRIAPYIDVNLIPDNSYFPLNVKEIDSKCGKLAGLETKNGKIQLKSNLRNSFIQYQDDGNWITVEEAMKTLGLKG